MGRKGGDKRTREAKGERRNETKKGKTVVFCILSLSRTPALTFLTSVSLKKVGTASVHTSFPNSSLTAACIGWLLGEGSFCLPGLGAHQLKRGASGKQEKRGSSKAPHGFAKIAGRVHAWKSPAAAVTRSGLYTQLDRCVDSPPPPPADKQNSTGAENNCERVSQRDERE